MSEGSTWIRTAFITVLGSGFAPFASGTWGSLAAIGLFLIPFGALLGLDQLRWLDLTLIAGILVACVASIRWGDWAIARFASGDPKPFVLDEFAGQWIALLVLPSIAFGGFWPFAFVIGGQFLLFRFFDIAKVPPAAQFERLPGGWGVLLDDLMAGVYANLAGQLLWRVTPLATWLGLAHGGAA